MFATIFPAITLVTIYTIGANLVHDAVGFQDYKGQTCERTAVESKLNPGQVLYYTTICK